MRGFILIVEDTPQVAANLEIALMPLGEVRVAGNAEDALREANRGEVAAVVTDLELPAMSGYEFVERLRADTRFTQTPVVVASGSTDPGARQRSMQAGANAYFAKPYSPAELRRELERLLNRPTGEQS